MIVYKCDFCGKELGVWLTVHVSPGAAHGHMNVAGLMAYQHTDHVCVDCYCEVRNLIATRKLRKEE